MRKWEYKSELMNADDTVEEAVRKFNLLGTEGWEVVQMIGGTYLSLVWFKREIMP